MYEVRLALFSRQSEGARFRWYGFARLPLADLGGPGGICDTCRSLMLSIGWV